MLRRFYTSRENFSPGSVVLDEDETRHLRDVLRLKKGDQIYVFNGEGREFQCEIASIEKKRSTARVITEVEPAAPESGLDLTLAAAVTKGERFDVVVQKAVELGVSRIIPLNAVRCIVKPGGNRRTERWRKIALEAAKQSGRARLMVVDEEQDLTDLIAAISRSKDNFTVMFSERNGGRFDLIRGARKMTAIIGPEGGWDDAELERAAASEIPIVTLGGRILRTETAGIALAALIQHRFGDLN